MKFSLDRNVKSLQRIAYGENENQFGDLRLPEGNGPFPVAILIHGGFWRAKYELDQMDKFAEDLTSRGIATWNIEYRRVGQEGGGWPGTFLDNAQAVDFVRTLAESYPLDLDRIVTIGHSAGGHLALWIAARHNLPPNSILKTSENPLSLKGAISLAGVCDPALMHDIHVLREVKTGVSDNPTRDLFDGMPKYLHSRYAEGSPIALLPICVPLVLIHGSLDINVPIGISEQFEKTAKCSGDDVILKAISSAEHFKIIDPESDEWPIVVESIVNLLNQ
ncbi:alpha/beta hydrolase [Bacillus sp. sid0103]|uniref:alpha/beta hydrolase family protein n=1 Tax=Bacillus sp. sid0103 TaxID=2856337 RepID=UPI001C49575C|nr:alpha/beta hydrolase [Bacillus sp. sid0103]MBV7508215.1 alpha/beta hydrolase [Bacillus sp. sid0103]